MGRVAPLNVDDYRRLARRRLPKGIFEYVDRGTEDERSLDDNRRALDDLKLVPRVLRDVRTVDLSTDLFGRSQPLPLIVAPTAVAGLVAHDGEVVVARAAARAGIPFCVATQSITSIERIAAESGARLWLQLYLFRDRGISFDLVDRARAVGAEALVLTVDTAVSPNREYNVRNGFAMPFRPNATALLDLMRHPRWMLSVWLRMLRTSGVPAYAHYPDDVRTRVGSAVSDRVGLDPSIDRDDLAALRRRWDGPLIVKGILHPDDAALAADLGADGIVVSNHGGRNVDGAIPPALALPAIVDRVGHRLAVLADSGVRRGTDVVKLVALGARGVLLGRSLLFGAAADGERGATHVLELLRSEMEKAMALLGQRALREVTRDLLAGARR